MKNLTKKTTSERKPANPDISKRITEILNYLKDEKKVTIKDLSLLWETTVANIYQLRDGYREITVKQANLLYLQYKIPHKKSMMGIGPMVELAETSTAVSEPGSEYGGNYKLKYEQSLKEIERLEKMIADKDKIIKLLER